MKSLLANIARVIVFRNIFIAICALCMSWETLYLVGFPLKADATIIFVFFSTFFVYNVHAFANHLVQDPFGHFFHLLDKKVSFVQRLSVVVGFIVTTVAFFFIPKQAQWLFILFGVITMAYTLPILKVKGRRMRLREISYVKIFTISFIWSVITVALPLVDHQLSLTDKLFWLILAERILFVYAITIPFEIRDMEQEQRFGVKTIPAIHGIENSKRLGYVLLLLFGILSVIHQYYYSSGKNIAIPLIVSGLLAGIFIFITGKERNKWFYKGWLDGTMVIQFFLLLLFNL